MTIRKDKKLDAWEGWGLLVGGGGGCPYMAYMFSTERADISAEVSEKYHKVVPAVVISRKRYRELLTAEHKLNKAKK